MTQASGTLLCIEDESSFSNNRQHSVSREMSGSVSLAISTRPLSVSQVSNLARTLAKAVVAKRAGAGPSRNDSCW
jgi:hypothetical protein